MTTTTIKLDRRSRRMVDDYAAAACWLKRGIAPLVNLDGVTQTLDMLDLVRLMNRFLLKATFDAMFPDYELVQYNVDTGIATMRKVS